MICTHVCLYVIQMQLLIILNVHQSLEVYCTYFYILKMSKLLHCWILVVLQILCLTVCIVVYQTQSTTIVKSNLQPLSFDKLELANGSFVTMIGTARVTLYVPRLSKTMHVVFHVLEQTSQPVILGTHFLAQSGISLDFSDPGKCSDIVCHRNYKVISKVQSNKQDFNCIVPRVGGCCVWFYF